MDYTYKRFSPDLINDCRYIYEATHGVKLSELNFLKKFDTAIFGAENIGYIAYSSENEAAAFYGVLPVKVIQFDQSILAAQAVEGMTHPDHRKKGLFKTLVLKTIELANENGIKFIFGFPNQNSYPAFIKFGWSNPFRTNQYSIGLNRNYLFRALGKVFPHIFSKIQIKGINRLKDLNKANLPSFFQISGNAMSVDRSQAYFNYKTYSDNFFVKKNEFYLWIKIENDILYIGDIFFNWDKFNGENIIKEIKELAKFFLLSQIIFYASPNHPLSKFFINNSITQPSLPLIIYAIDKNFDLKEDQFTYSYADFDTF